MCIRDRCEGARRRRRAAARRLARADHLRRGDAHRAAGGGMLRRPAQGARARGGAVGGPRSDDGAGRGEARGGCSASSSGVPRVDRPAIHGRCARDLLRRRGGRRVLRRDGGRAEPRASTGGAPGGSAGRDLHCTVRLRADSRCRRCATAVGARVVVLAPGGAGRPRLCAGRQLVLCAPGAADRTGRGAACLPAPRRRERRHAKGRLAACRPAAGTRRGCWEAMRWPVLERACGCENRSGRDARPFFMSVCVAMVHGTAYTVLLLHLVHCG
eukprot:4946902-Prymnesium_polylepis.1